MPKPLTLGEVARRSRDGEGKDADKKQKTQRYKPCLSETSYRCAFVFYFAGLALSGAGAPALPKGRALGKEGSSPMKPICVCWKTSRNAKASHFERLPRPGEVARKCRKGARWHGEAVTERARMLPKSQTHSDTHPACQRHRIAVLSCFILPGLPSQALTRQLSQRESPWQRGQALVYASMPWSAGG